MVSVIETGISSYEFLKSGLIEALTLILTFVSDDPGMLSSSQTPNLLILPESRSRRNDRVRVFVKTFLSEMDDERKKSSLSLSSSPTAKLHTEVSHPPAILLDS